MTDEQRESICRLLAAKMGYLWECKVCGARPDVYGTVRHGKGCFTQSEDGGGESFEEIPNYFDSEDDSARLLCAMPAPDLTKWRDSGLWACKASPSLSHEEHEDRKTAIVLAACQWKQIEIPTD